ncbi:Hint domain-containing protein [Gymnodinialimonas hymeniacidonis]|uniref:Hint domain-containing protein n=1 Tax=Gymnodinialimonas hymeniacidonis TaxID=3126508 RepID=UPI0034C6A933
MPSFSTSNGSTATYTDTTPGTGVVIDFDSLDNSFNIQVNGVQLFVGGPAGAPNEAEFQSSGTAGQTVRFADGDLYAVNTQEIWQQGNTNGEPIVRLEINPDGTISFWGVKTTNGPLEPLELFNGMTVNTAAIAAAWNDPGTNTITMGQAVTGPTNSSGDFEDVICFAAGTLIDTERGAVRVEDLRVGDQVRTVDDAFKPILWIGSCAVTPEQLASNPKLRPILIRSDALGAGFPSTDLVVSPQHRVLVSSAVAMRMFGAKEVLIPAIKLLPLDGVEVRQEIADGAQYWHFLLETHEVVWSNGMPTESLYTGPEALKAVSTEAREELLTLFPRIGEASFAGHPARPIPEKGKRMRKLVQRHRINNKPLIAGGAQQSASA